MGIVVIPKVTSATSKVVAKGHNVQKGRSMVKGERGVARKVRVAGVNLRERKAPRQVGFGCVV